MLLRWHTKEVEPAVVYPPSSILFREPGRLIHDTHPPLRDRLAALEKLGSVERDVDETPSIALLAGVDGLELQLLQTIHRDGNVASLRPVAWENIGSEVYLPAWREMAGGHGSLLANYTVERLPEAVRNLNEIAMRLPDSKGTLLSREQRVERAAHLLTQAFAVALWDHGWQIHATPGELYFQLEGERIEPGAVVAGMRSGVIKAPNWSQRCRSTAISDWPLTPSAP